MKRILSLCKVILPALAIVAITACSESPSVQQDILADAQQDAQGDSVVPLDTRVDTNVGDRIEDTGLDVLSEDTADVQGDAIQAGKFGAPCLDNKDCESNYCVEGVNGLVCSRMCNNDCPEDWYCRTVQTTTDPVNLCMPSGVFLCRACMKNSQCADGLCLAIGEGSYCSRLCSDFMTCPDGYTCQDVTDPETQLPSKQCLPTNGTCTCSVKNDGEVRACSKDNDIGSCPGTETCHKDTGWTVCTASTPSVEVCDGIDNDCNRVSDDNAEPPAGDCFNTVGTMSCQGEWLCRGADGWDCYGQIPAEETCNNKDDDCNGQTDETFKTNGKYVSIENCGQCGASCEGLIPFAKTVECYVGTNAEDVPECRVTECFPGYFNVDGHTCRAAISSLCVPCEEDADCGSDVNRCLQLNGGTYCARDCSASGIYGTECPTGFQCSDIGSGVMQCVPISGTCECTLANNGIKRICEIKNGYGTCQGNEVCDGNVGWINCSAKTPAEEVCDGLDNDCDGLVDNDPTEPADPCENSWTDPGSGNEYTCAASWSCAETVNGKEWVCTARTPTAETCNAIDDNCNGETDENFKLAGTNKYNDYYNCGACGVSCDGLVQHAVMKCDATLSQPACRVDSCEDGWWKASDLSCVPFPQSECLACSSDASCQIPGDSCLPGDSLGNTYCMWDCSEDALRPETDPDRRTCPEGYYCRETNDLGQPLLKCFPESNACDCLAANSGQVRACVVSNSYGRCFGDETCNPASGWSLCNAQTPAAETCNNNDDDCNGLVDESFPTVGATCTDGIGACMGVGMVVCTANGLGVKCNAVAGQPTGELCDLLDNDCDNAVDEDFPDYGKVCFIGTGECRSSGVYVCSQDGQGVVCNAPTINPGTEICDDRDNDCDDAVDETFLDKGKVCSSGIGECLANGVWVCSDNHAGLTCNAVEKQPGTELCDGRDNDCDLQIDETWPEYGTVCVVGDGACRNTGVYRCTTDKLGIECSVTAGNPGVEVCDGIDNDCDGQIDENWTDKGKACQEGDGECADTGVWVCKPDKSGIECDATPGTPSLELCDGKDNDCDGQIDETWTIKGTACQEGQGECLANGVWVCKSDKSGVECSADPAAEFPELCDGRDNDCDGQIDEDWTNKGYACQEGYGACLDTGVIVCTADKTGVECSANPGTPSTEVCDGIDNDCDQAIDELWTDKGKACQEGVGECLDTGVWVCTGDKSGIECDATPGAPVIELCDGLDNDCDGGIDEHWTDKGRACQEGDGACLDTGVWVCKTDKSGIECDATPGTPTAELCDGIDNDCDGQIDETWTNKGTACQEGYGECADTGVWVCKTDKSGVECSANPGTPSAELCDGLDNDCDQAIDEDWTNKGYACQEGDGACLDTGVIVCKSDKTGVECNANPGTPVAELCDGLDNDCDGLIDETWTNKGTACQEGYGECADTGVWVCTGDKSGIECSANPGTPTAEVCDGLDNDCDQSIDELWTDKGKACQEGQGECFDTGVWVCKPDKSGIECDATPGTPSAELCDGLDNDCDGEIDETWTDKGRACQEGYGECLANGVWVCMGDKSGIECSANPGTPTTELCDGKDNDCDQSIDETWANKGMTCQAGKGACLANGVYVCKTDKSNVECNAVQGTPSVELCDGIDNDCDDSTDETWTNKGTACQKGQGECLASGVWVCKTDKSNVECNAVEGTPSSELCDNKDNDCDGGTDEDWADKGAVCTVGVGQCVATGTWVCNGAKSGIECSATEGTPVAEECDYLDNDCDGVTDDGFAVNGDYVGDTACGNCFTDCTLIYDLPNASGVCNTSAAPTCEMVCDEGWYDLNQVPEDGCEFFLDETAIYVSHNDAMAADTAGCGLAPSILGTGQYPCMTITYGLARAQALPGRTNVLVSNGQYNESVILVGGINLKGGYRADTWERDVEATLTNIRGATGSGHTMAVYAHDISTPTVFEGFIVQGATSTGSGMNSYAIYIKDCNSTLQVLNNVVYAAAGTPGTAGTAGASGVAGVNGSIGQGTLNINIVGGTCWGDPALGYLGRLGGAGGSRTCDNPGGGTTNVSGGTGGWTSCPAFEREEGSTTPNASPGGGQNGNGPNPGTGGPGGYGSHSTSGTCYPPTTQVRYGTAGGDATKGTDGSGGTGASTASGSVSSDNWVGSSGNSGVAGGHGSGGGGGGGGAGNDRDSNNKDDFGGAGGGGGSGGCAGFSGNGGGAGGGSFGIFVTFTGVGPTFPAHIPVITGNTVNRGLGGAGGKGGNGGTGGDGGAGGAGGPIENYSYMLFCVFAGEKGGAGSRGGHAGGGGGGAGGVSWDIYVNNMNAVTIPYGTGNTFGIAAGTNTAGSGGSGGLSSNTTTGIGGTGVAGEYGNIKTIP